MMRQNVLRWLVAALAWGLLAGCGMAAGDDQAPPVTGATAINQVPNRAPDVEGTVTQVTSSGDTLTLLVDFASGGGTMTDSVRVMAGETTIMRQSYGQAVAATAAELTTGTEVKLWYTGPVLESYPRQATAAAVLIATTP